jgi:hypothetical protein
MKFIHTTFISASLIGSALLLNAVSASAAILENNAQSDAIVQVQRELNHNPKKRSSLAAHFHMTESALLAFIGDQLQAAPLSQAQPEREFLLTGQGKEISKIVTLPEGTLQLVRKDNGQPMLRVSNGDPVEAEPSHVLPAIAGLAKASPAASLTWLPALGGVAGLVASSGSAQGTGDTTGILSAPTSLAEQDTAVISGESAAGSSILNEPAGDSSSHPALVKSASYLIAAPEPDPLLVFFLGSALLSVLSLHKQLSRKRLSPIFCSVLPGDPAGAPGRL